MDVWNMIFLFNLSDLRFHVNFQGCITVAGPTALFGDQIHDLAFNKLDLAK